MYCSNYGSDVVERTIILLVNDPRSQRNSTTNWREYISSPLSLESRYSPYEAQAEERCGHPSRVVQSFLRTKFALF